MIYCFEETQTSHEIKLQCLKLFHKFVAYIAEEDFMTLELEPTLSSNF
jgi:hypothetical protein